MELGQILSHIRRYISLTNVRAQGLCLLARLCHIGEGAKEAAGRRKAAKIEEGRRRVELQSHFAAHIRGRGLSRTGSKFVLLFRFHTNLK